jgi:hypothetical protein
MAAAAAGRFMPYIRDLVNRGTHALGENPLTKLNPVEYNFVLSKLIKWEESKVAADNAAALLAGSRSVYDLVLQSQVNLHRRLQKEAETNVQRIVGLKIRTPSEKSFTVAGPAQQAAPAGDYHVPGERAGFYTRNVTRRAFEKGELILQMVERGTVPPAELLRDKSYFSSLGRALQTRGFLPESLNFTNFDADHIISGRLIRDAFIKTLSPGNNADGIGVAVMRIINNGSSNFGLLPKELNRIKGAIETGRPFNGVYYVDLRSIVRPAELEIYAHRAIQHVEKFPENVYNKCRDLGSPVTNGTMRQAEAMKEELLKTVGSVFGPIARMAGFFSASNSNSNDGHKAGDGDDTKKKAGNDARREYWNSTEERAHEKEYEKAANMAGWAGGGKAGAGYPPALSSALSALSSPPIDLLDKFHELLKIITTIENLIELYFNDLNFTYDDLFNIKRELYIKNSPIKNSRPLIHTNNTHNNPTTIFFPSQEDFDKSKPPDKPPNIIDAEITLFLVQYYYYILTVHYNPIMLKIEQSLKLSIIHMFFFGKEEMKEIKEIEDEEREIGRQRIRGLQTLLAFGGLITFLKSGGGGFKKTRKHRSKKHKRYSRKK